ncbi:MAG: HNH endonuclease [Bacteroidota bacterium]
MIKLSRIIDAKFPKNFYEGSRKAWERELIEEEIKVRRDSIDKHDFATGRWKSAKAQLSRETKQKCAYCESPFAVVAYGDVEHYRPKSKYWWLAYSYENYLVSCQICNQKFKRDVFPVVNNRIKPPRFRVNSSQTTLNTIAGKLSPNPKNPADGMDYATFMNEYFAERPLCINPYYEDPANYFKYEFNDAAKEVTIIPVSANLKAYVAEAENVYGINRKELLRMRYVVLFHYRIHRETRDTNSSTSRAYRLANKAILTLLEGKSGYSGMIKYYETQASIPLIPESML